MASSSRDTAQQQIPSKSSHTRIYLESLLPAHLRPTPSSAYKPQKPSSLSSTESASDSQDEGDEEEDDDEDDEQGRKSARGQGEGQDRISGSSGSSSSSSTPAAKRVGGTKSKDAVASILDILEDTNAPEEDKIDDVRTKLDEWLSEVEGKKVPSVRLDNIVLDIMHRHREDLNPTGASFISSPARRPGSAMSNRSFSGSRPWTPTTPTHTHSFLDSTLHTPGPSTPNLGGSTPLTTPASPRAGVIGSGSPRASPRLWNRTLSNLSVGGSSTPPPPGLEPPRSPISSLPLGLGGSRPASPSPLGSPRLNVAAIEFKPRTGSSSSTTSTGLPLTRPSFVPVGRTESWLSRSSASASNLANKSHAGAGEDDDDEFSPFGSAEATGGAGASASTASSFGRPSSGSMAIGAAGESDVSWYSSSTSATSSSSGYDPSPLGAAAAAGRAAVGAPGELGEDDEEAHAMAGISMTPFDVLYAVLAGSGAQWSPEQVDEVLGQNNYDVEATMAYIMDNGGLPSAPVAPKAATDPNAATPPPPNAPSGAPVPVSTGPASAGSPRFPHRTAGSGGVSVVAREAFTNHRGGSPHSPSRFGIISRSATPPGRAIGGGRVCRYFLAGECRRADCRFSHDLGRALCRFWLRGQCLNDPCSFLHDYDVVNALASGIASSSVGPSHSPAPIEPETPPNEEFPELGFAPPLGPKAQQPKKPTTATAPGPSAAADPSHTRWAAALKRQAPTPLSLVQGDQRFINVHARGAPTRAPPAVARGGAAANVAGGAPSSRPSPRIALRAPTLLPTLVTGSAVENSYTKYRNSALALSEKRNQCLARAAEAWKAGDGAGAKHWSREGAALNARLFDESRGAASQLIRDRHTHLRERLRAGSGNDGGGWGSASYASDEAGARGLRGKEVGSGLGVCLGVAGRDVQGAGGLTVEERTECLVDLHGLHAGEAVELVEEFLLGLEREQMRGLAYLAVGEGRHASSTSSNPSAGASGGGSSDKEKKRTTAGGKIASAVKGFLAGWGYPYAEHEGIIVTDPCTHY